MTAIQEKIDKWPKDRKQRPIFQSSEDAVFYAHLIVNHVDLVERLKVYRLDIYNKLAWEKQRKNPNFQLMLNMACNAQFYRECIEEVSRIKSRSNHLN